MKIIDILTESTQLFEARIDHPEDLVFSDGIDGAKRAVEALTQTAQDEKSITIKWDGFPALIFGRNERGELIVADKHMFDKKDGSGRVTSPAAFRQYDVNRGANRNDLYQKIDVLWPALEQVVPRNVKGYYWGDLLYVGKLKPTKGAFAFRPNTVTYTVAANSELGQRISQSVGGIAVHTFIDASGGSSALTDISSLGQGPIMFVSGAMPVKLAIKVDKRAVAQTMAVITKNSAAVTTFLAQLNAIKAKGIVGALSTYITAKIASGNFDNMIQGFYQYLPNKLSPAAQAKLLGNNRNGWLYTEGATGIAGLLQIWSAIYNLKLNIKQQIDAQMASSPVQATIDGTAGHEGYVAGSGVDKIKLIDRLAFSRANFAKTR